MDDNPVSVGITNTDSKRIKYNVIMNEESQYLHTLLCLLGRDISISQELYLI